MSILVTGFERFGGLITNPTELIANELSKVRSLEDAGLVTEVLPTEYRAAGSRICTLIRRVRPRAVLALGAAPTAKSFLLERFALNLDDTPEPDNAGWIPAGLPILADGPAAYKSTLPLGLMHERISAAGIPVRYSNHAGTYVCNHVFYLACHETALQGGHALCGFVHVPLAVAVRGQGAASMTNLFLGVQECLAVVRESLARLAPMA